MCSERKGAASRACSERNITCENIFVENFAISKQRHSQKTVWGDEFATLSTYYGYFCRVWFNSHRPGLQQDLNLLRESSISFSSHLDLVLRVINFVSFPFIRVRCLRRSVDCRFFRVELGIYQKLFSSAINVYYYLYYLSFVYTLFAVCCYNNFLCTYYDLHIA